jgi:hypothetical protein
MHEHHHTIKLYDILMHPERPDIIQFHNKFSTNSTQFSTITVEGACLLQWLNPYQANISIQSLKYSINVLCDACWTLFEHTYEGEWWTYLAWISSKDKKTKQEIVHLDIYIDAKNYTIDILPIIQSETMLSFPVTFICPKCQKLVE